MRSSFRCPYRRITHPVSPASGLPMLRIFPFRLLRKDPADLRDHDERVEVVIRKGPPVPWIRKA